MSQAIAICVFLNSLDNMDFPEGLLNLYHIILKEGNKIKKCKKKWFKQHYVVYIDDPSGTGEYRFHLTPHKSWWEVIWY